ncbi:MAG: glycosyltransferase [Saprospiraceae bacterium]
MKRILIIGAAYPYRGGLAAFNERLAFELIQMGHEVQLITFTVQYPRILFPGKSQFSDDPAPDLNITRWMHAFNPFNWFLVGRKIKAIKPDIIVCKFWLPAMAPCFGTILRMSKSNTTSLVSILDNVIPHEHRTGDRLFTKYFLSIIDRFIYMSHQVGEELKLFNQHKPAIFIPHPIYDNYGQRVSREIALTQLKLSDHFRYVLFFGFIREYKGLDLLYHSIHTLGNDLQNIKFIIAGEYYTDARPYESLVQDLNISDRLILRTNFISNNEVKYYFSAADIIVQPYKSATQSGIAQIAIHFSKPAIVTKVGGLHEIVYNGKTGYVVNPDANEIAQALRTFYSIPNFQEMEIEVSGEKEKYNWSHMAKGVLNEI